MEAEDTHGNNRAYIYTVTPQWVPSTEKAIHTYTFTCKQKKQLCALKDVYAFIKMEKGNIKKNNPALRLDLTDTWRGPNKHTRSHPEEQSLSFS